MNVGIDINQESLYRKISKYIDSYDGPIQERFEAWTLLERLISLKKCHGPNHPSMPDLLHRIVNILDDLDLLQFSRIFLLEQLRIENIYLGSHHPDLAPTFYKIGENFVKNDQLLEAEAYFSKAFLLLEDNNKKGKIYAKTTYNMGLIHYHKGLCDEAFECFGLALEEQRIALGESHPDVAEMCQNIGDIHKEIGKLEDAMHNYLEALMILRMTHGNTHSNVSKILHKIGVMHRVKGDDGESLNAFHQALNIARNLKNEDELIIIILHEIALIYQRTEDVKNMTKIFEDVVELIKQKLGTKHMCVAAMLDLLRILYREDGMVEKSDIVAKEIKGIHKNGSNDSHSNVFVDTVMKLFGQMIDNSVKVVTAEAA